MIQHKYFIFISDNHYVAKNRLHHEIAQLALSYHKRLIDDDELNPTVSEIENKISILNQAHSRCKPFVIHFHKSHSDEKNDWIIGVSGVFRLSFYQCK